MDDNRDDKGNLNYIFDGEEKKPDAVYQNNYNQPGLNPYAGQPRLNNFAKVFLSVVLAFVMFIGGFLVAWYAVPSEEEKLARFIKGIADKYYYDVDGRGVDFIDSIGNAMVGSLDQYSSFYSGESLQNLYREREGKFNDTGMAIITENGECVVIKVYGGSPAYEAGIRAGDVLERVNDYATAGKTLAQIREKIAQIQAEGGNPTYHFRRYLGGTTQTYQVNNLKREEYEPVFSYYRDSASIEELPADAAYITLEEFSAGADVQFKANLDKFKQDGKKNLILDMRTNPGGGLDILENIASYLIRDGKGSQTVHLTTVEFKDKSTEKYYTSGSYYDSYFAEDSRIVVLANGYSASATEVLICAMKDYGTIYQLVGEKTFGKAVMQAYFEYQKKFGVYVTVALLYSPVTNVTYNGIGFEPDVEVGYQKAGELSYDPQFLAAVQALTESAPL